jgi:hypothetical protein
MRFTQSQAAGSGKSKAGDFFVASRFGGVIIVRGYDNFFFARVFRFRVRHRNDGRGFGAAETRFPSAATARHSLEARLA